MRSSEDLKKLLRDIDHRGYPAYKGLKGAYSFGDYVLSIDHVQGDPFASPSRLSVIVAGKGAGFPGEYYKERHCRIALQDHICRAFYRETEKYSFKAGGSGKSGLIQVSRCGQEVLERSAVTIRPSDGELRASFSVGLPANGRTINAAALSRILFDFIPACVSSALFYKSLSKEELRRDIELCEDQHFIRESLDSLGLCAFVANGSVLPRRSGVSDLPMKEAVSFVSPKSLELELRLPHRGEVRGMGIKKGITLIIGGGYHGKSTLLKALERGVYDHIYGDGRELVITDPTAFKVRAEDGRSIKAVDISMFINGLPSGKDTRSFSTEDASGSTSQAANVVEAMESGTGLFLIDEDTCATNFMVRDELMQSIVSRNKEPITPFIDRVRILYEKCGISTVLVAGNSGAYFHIADTIIQMDEYIPKDITKEAKQAAERYKKLPIEGASSFKLPNFSRIPRPNTRLRGEGRIKSKARGTDDVRLGHENIDLRYLEQIVDKEQTTALSAILALMELELIDGKHTVTELTDKVCGLLERDGLQALSGGGYTMPDMAMPRRQEIFGCIDRYRGLRL